MHLGGFAVEHRDAGVGEDLSYLVCFSGFKIMIAQHRHTGHAKRCSNLLCEHTGFLGESVVREVAAHDEEIGTLRDLRKDRGQSAVPRLADVDVAHGRKAHDSGRGRHPSAGARGITSQLS